MHFDETFPTTHDFLLLTDNVQGLKEVMYVATTILQHLTLARTKFYPITQLSRNRLLSFHSVLYVKKIGFEIVLPSILHTKY